MCSPWRNSKNSSRLALTAAAVLHLSCGPAGTNGDAVVSPGRLERPLSFESRLQPGKPVVPVRVRNPYEDDPEGVAEGRRLYHWYNCSGCHFNGGGGIGPPFLDEDWIYGGEAQNIYDSIMRGRPNGMPAYGGRIPEMQAWQIAAFVRSMSPDRVELDEGVPLVEGLNSQDGAPRLDHSSRTDGGRTQ